MQKPSFHVDLCDAALEYLTKTYENIYNEELEEELRWVIQRACSLYFSTVIPRRSYKNTFEKPRVNKEKYSGSWTFCDQSHKMSNAHQNGMRIGGI